MEWELIVALVIGIPIILFPFPAAFVWYLNLGGLVQAMRERHGIEKERRIRRR